MIRHAAFLLALSAAPAAAETLQQRAERALAALPAGTRAGLVVADADGRELIAIAPDGRFIPASNTKITTTAAAYARLPALDAPDVAGGARVRLEADGAAPPTVVLEGRGDARLSSAPDCRADCLATLADAVAAATRRVGTLVGDDSWFPDERWGPGMSWNNMDTRSGTAVSALTLDDNEWAATVSPGPVGAPATVAADGFYPVANAAVTIAAGPTRLSVTRAPGASAVRITGAIVVGAAPVRLVVGLDDPARRAAWMLRRMLLARGVAVTGGVAVRHRPLAPADDPMVRGDAPAAIPPETPALAALVPPPLADDIALTNRVSQNLHAELLLRRLGRARGSGSIADGAAIVRGVLAGAGVPRAGYDFADGSGMSTYNRLSPRAAVTLLGWIARQPWGAAWQATLPVAGEGTLRRRFVGTPLADKLWAKTGTLNATTALSGWYVGASGRRLAFSLLVNDIPADASVTATLDAALLAIAAGS